MSGDVKVRATNVTGGIAVGQGAQAVGSGGSINNSAPLDLATLAAQLAALRAELLVSATTADRCVALGAVATAEAGARSGSSSKVREALSTLGPAARWVLDAATKIGVSLACEAIRSHSAHL